jgi:hypothetical protein
MALLPPPFVLLYLPGIYNIAHKIECVTGVVFEEVVELFGLTISGTEVYI